jgi:hypothetical protein
MRRRRPNKRALRDLLRQTQQLQKQVAAFKASAGGVHGSLDPLVPDDEVEIMESARADLLGTLECLLNEDLEDAVRHLGELEELLESDETGLEPHRRAGKRPRSGEGVFTGGPPSRAGGPSSQTWEPAALTGRE